MVSQTLAFFLILLWPFNQVQQQPSQQKIAIRIINSQTGKPIITDNIEVWIDKNQQHAIRSHTSSDGIANVDLPSEVSEILVNAQQDGWYLVHCDFSKSVNAPIPFYSINVILRLGISAPNFCNHKTSPMHPGELTVFLHPQSLWEKMKS